MMNAIAAHKDELKKLLENLSDDTAASEIGFVAFLDAYIRRLDTNCSDISRPRRSAASANKRRINMEPTLTQNCALYYVQHKTSKPRATFFQRSRAAARKRAPDSHRLLTPAERSTRLAHYQDNGR